MENSCPLSDLKGHRTLATIVFTDCVNFSARMSVSEIHTLDLIQRDVSLMQQICSEHGGRVLKSTGDGLLMYFPSAVNAVESALKIQSSLSQLAGGRSPDDILLHRIGIHLADIFISETDVMGNGVNIAARLQAEAEPGGICISQTVYDVVKTGLNLAIQYLGPRELKNIAGVVPVYKIILDSRQPPTSGSADNLQVETLSPYLRLAQELQRLDSSGRIKKLLHYVCYGRWEGDISYLAAIQMLDLVQQLHQLAPTPDVLQSTLARFVQTLSKQEEYTWTANLIVQTLLCLYPSNQSLTPSPGASGREMETQLLQTPVSQLTTNPPLQRYQSVLQGLTQDRETLRIRKLMLYACHRQWESDLGRLQQLDLLPLVQELQHLAPTLRHLETTLDAIVWTLNKPTEYQAIVRAIASYMAPLYVTSQEPIASAPSVLNQPMTSEVRPSQSIAATEIFQAPQDVARSQPPPELPLSLVDATSSQEPAKRDRATQPTGEPPDLFDYRLELIKYANPLRAKQLIASALAETTDSPEADWLNLRYLEMDDLLQQVLSRCQQYTDLELLLYETARRQPTPEEAVQTASAVIQCLRPFYIYGASAPLASAASVETQISQAESVAPLSCQPDQDADLTCQLFHSPLDLKPLNQPTKHPTEVTGPSGKPINPPS